MELKEKMYIRYKGQISKVEKIKGCYIELENIIKDEFDDSIYSLDFNIIYNTKDIKWSDKLIDLIKVGDVIVDLDDRKYEVIHSYSPKGKYTLWIQLSNETFIDSTDVHAIKQVLTKEQFELKSFKAGK